ncbi:MAG: hypothetical protein HC821_00070 [Lewinella sp.]|nr:hypothetical protein [Lewinella sp.]
MLLRAAFNAVRLRQQLLLQWTTAASGADSGQLLLEWSVQSLIISVYRPGQPSTPAVWTLGQSELFEAIALAYFNRLALGPAEEGLVAQLNQQIDLAAQQLNQNLAWTREELLAHLSNV